MWILLALKGLIIALVPGVIIYLSRGEDKFKRLAWVTVFLTFDLIVFGAFTRLTDSGLGCPDWPGCYGEANPFLAHDDISAAQSAMPTGPVTVFKAWIEMIHRYLAMAVGVLIIAICVGAVHQWRKNKNSRYHPVLPLVLLIFVCIQGAFGAWTVTLKLQPIIVTTHLLLGLSLLALLCWHALRQTVYEPVTTIITKNLKILAAVTFFLLGMQIALGGWVSTNYAALACGGFPLCQSQFMPEMNLEQGYTLWRHLGMTANGEYLPFSALVAINWVHRCFALVVVVAISALVYQTWKIPAFKKLAQGLLVVLILQLISGAITVQFDWPLAVAVAHNAGAAALVFLLAMLNYRLSLTGQSARTEHSEHSSLT
jgi:cytochrome c oxidase assembly protein subunit 15